MRRLTTLLLIVFCASLAMGGSFTCKSSSNDDFHDRPPPENRS